MKYKNFIRKLASTTTLSKSELDDYLPDNSIYDVLSAHSLRQGQRAGKAKALTEAAGLPKDIAISHPYSHTATYTLGGGLLGGLTGLSLAASTKNDGISKLKNYSLGGAAIGGLLGSILASVVRGNKIKKLKNEIASREKLNPDRISTNDTPYLRDPSGAVMDRQARGLVRLLKTKIRDKKKLTPDTIKRFEGNIPAPIILEQGLGHLPSTLINIPGRLLAGYIASKGLGR